MDTQIMVECQKVGRVYTSRTITGKREVKALDEIDLTVQKGTVFGLLGPNGAGKTTLIRVFSTLLTPTTGKALVAGFDVVKDAVKVRRKIGLILGGDRGLYGRLTGPENLKYAAALNHLAPELAKKRIGELLEMVGLKDVGKRPVEQYSRGMRQRLHIARGLLSDPEILFMDEPTIGLDPMGAQEVRHFVPELTKQGKTIFLTTHYMQEADELCSELAIISKGNIVARGKPSDIKHKFSQITVFDIILKKSDVNVVKELEQLPRVKKVNVFWDGPVQKLTIIALPVPGVENEIKAKTTAENIESMLKRDPTLEEAYISILQ
ncbi:MAG: ATP-binding cassette domain-containing protein [Dehalococcoidales bacterium]|nr:ATP-binding cassette domain-containing protein [Dehalococcoidales bacterium]